MRAELSQADRDAVLASNAIEEFAHAVLATANRVALLPGRHRRFGRRHLANLRAGKWPTLYAIAKAAAIVEDSHRFMREEGMSLCRENFDYLFAITLAIPDAVECAQHLTAVIYASPGVRPVHLPKEND